MWIAIQADGSRIRFESWVIQMYVRKELTDPILLASLDNAINIYEGERVPFDPPAATIR